MEAWIIEHVSDAEGEKEADRHSYLFFFFFGSDLNLFQKELM